MDFAVVHIVITLLMMVSLITLILWAWSARRRPRFDAAAQVPLEGDIVLGLSKSSYESPSPLAGEGRGEGDHILNDHMLTLSPNPSPIEGEGSFAQESRS